MIGVTIDASGIADIEMIFARFPEVASKAMSIAINETARGPALDIARQAIMAQVNFPEGYLNNDRLGVTQWSTPDHLQAVISGRDRPTLLSRFSADRPDDVGAIKATNRKLRGNGADRGRITVMVHPNEPKPMANAFFVPLRSGANMGNVGLAIRLRPGESIGDIRAYKPVQLYPEHHPDVYLLYGPSVDQVFKGVVEEIIPQVTEALDREFTRQFARLSGATR